MFHPRLTDLFEAVVVIGPAAHPVEILWDNRMIGHRQRKPVRAGNGDRNDVPGAALRIGGRDRQRLVGGSEDRSRANGARWSVVYPTNTRSDDEDDGRQSGGGADQAARDAHAIQHSQPTWLRDHITDHEYSHCRYLNGKRCKQKSRKFFIVSRAHFMSPVTPGHHVCDQRIYGLVGGRRNRRCRSEAVIEPA